MVRHRVLDHIRERCGLSDGADAERAAEMVVGALGRGLDRRLARDVARRLPEAWARALVPLEAEEADAPPLEALYDQLKDALPVTRGVAAEIVEVTLSEIADEVGPDLRRRMTGDLPEAWGARLTPPEIARERRRETGAGVPPHRDSPARGGPTAQKRRLATSGSREDSVAKSHPTPSEPLSEGRPGSRRPISEAGQGGKR